MHRNTLRLVLVGIAVFYAVFGGLWVTNYVTGHETERLSKIMTRIEAQHEGTGYSDDPEYKKAQEAFSRHYRTHEDDSVYAARVSLFQAILLWGTVALGVGASVLFLTRGKRGG